MRRNRIKAICLISFIFLSFIFTSCHPYYQWSDNDVVWYSSEPEMVIIHAEDYYLDGYLSVGNEKIKVTLVWSFSRYFYIVDFEKNNEGAVFEEMTYISGAFKFDGEKAILTVEEDKIFDGKYKTIVLQKKPYVKGEYDIL